MPAKTWVVLPATTNMQPVPCATAHLVRAELVSGYLLLQLHRHQLHCLSPSDGLVQVLGLLIAILSTPTTKQTPEHNTQHKLIPDPLKATTASGEGPNACDNKNTWQQVCVCGNLQL
jgi:hypothetical protein